MWKLYRLRRTMSLRPYVQEEDMTGIGIHGGDSPRLGGMIGRIDESPTVQWYLSPETVAQMYEPVPLPRARQALRPGTKALKARPSRKSV